MQRSTVVIGAYNLMPEGMEESAFEETYQVAWRPFLSTLYRFPGIFAALHYSGTVLHWLESRHPEFLMLLEEMALRKQVELLGGGFYAPLFPLIPGPDRLGQVELLTTFIRRSFGKRPRGCWLPDYAWEPVLASSLQSSGFEYAFLPERSFRAAGLSPESIGKPVMTEDQGRSLLVFPVFDALESFASLPTFVGGLDELARRTDDAELLTILFPGEAAQALWAASKLESPDVFFERSFAELQREGLRFETTTPSRYLKGKGDFERAYFPGSASLRLMDGGACARKKERKAVVSPSVQADPPPLLDGSTRSILLSHEESLGLYAKMHYVRLLVGQLRGDKSRKKTAQEELWKAQCGGAYWPGPGGGISRLSVRASAYAALIEAEKITRQRGSFAPGIIVTDMDFDGSKEILYQGGDFNAYVQLRGACLFELDSLRSRTNYINVMSLDGGPRKLCFRDRLCEKASFGPDKGALSDASFTLVDAERPASMASLFREGFVELGGKKRGFSMKKTFSFRKGSLSVDYELTNRESSPISLRFGTEFNLAAGLAPEAVELVGLRGHEELGLETGRKSSAESLLGFRIANSAKGEKLELRADQPFVLSHSPSNAEAPIAGQAMGGCRAVGYQGCAILLGWDTDIPADSTKRLSLTLELRS